MVINLRRKISRTLRGVTFAAMILLVASEEALAQNLPPPGAYQPIPNFTGVRAGLQFREAINDRFSGAQPIAPSIASPAFANLPPEQDGMLLFCKDCRNATPCVSGGSGAFAFGEGGLWSCAGAATAWPVSLTENLLTGGHAINGSTTSGGDQINNLSVNGARNPASYGVISGSQNTGVVTISAGSMSATLAAAGDWTNGEGIAVPGAGSTPSISTPTAPTASGRCSGTCATGYTYKVAALDGKGGWTAASSASGSVNNAATLTQALNNLLTIPIANGDTALLIYRVGTGLIAIIPASEENANNSSPAAYYRDTGATAITLAAPYTALNSPPASAGPDALYTTITAGGGTTTLTLAGAATSSVTTQTSYHDDAFAINTCLASGTYATGAHCALPPDMTFVASQSVGAGGAPGASNNTWAGIQLTGGSYTSIATTPMMQGMSVIKGVNTFQMATDGININSVNGALCAIEHNVNNPIGGAGGTYVGENQDSNLNFSTGQRYYGICYTASAAYDQNNSENVIRVLQGSAANAAVLVGNSQALQNDIYGGNFTGVGEGAVELHGGSFHLLGGIPSSNVWMFDFEAGSYDHQSSATGVTVEIGPATLYADAAATFSGSNNGISITNSDLGMQSSHVGGLAVDVESTGFVLRVSNSRWQDGGSAENIIFRGTWASIIDSWSGAGAIINGSGAMSILRTYFASGAPTITTTGTFCGQQNIPLNVLPGNPGNGIGGINACPQSAPWDSATVQIPITGSTAGTAACSEPMAGGSFKVVNCLLTGYQETGTAQTVCFNGGGCTANLGGVNFSTAPNILASCGTYEPTATATVLTLPANASMTAETCNITAIGQ